MKRTLPLRHLLPIHLVAASISIPAARAETYGAFTYSGGSITGYASDGPAVAEIPSEINGTPITHIANWAFFNRANITHVTIPDGVHTISEGAFNQCANLTSVSMADSVTSMAQWTFTGCKNLTSVTLSGGLTGLPPGAFEGCTKLASISLPQAITFVSDRAFSGCSSLTSVTSATPLAGVGYEAFRDCIGLTSINLADGCSLSDYAFYSSSISLGGHWNFGFVGVAALAGNGVSSASISGSAGSYAFTGCQSLTTVVVGENATISDYAFNFCPNLSAVIFRGNAPSGDRNLFGDPPSGDNAVIYYMPGKTGWGSTFSGRPTAPAIQIVDHPQSITANQGANAVFSPVVTGPSLTYQWQKNGVDIPGATGLTLTLANVQEADAGVYQLVATSPAGSLTTQGAQLAFFPDTDGDGLSDVQEDTLTGTNPAVADSDGDGTPDGLEDPDEDGLTHLAEVSQYGTDPLKADTDGDDCDDGIEVNHPASYFMVVEGTFSQMGASIDAASRRGRVAAFPNASDFTRMANKARRTTQAPLWIGLSDAAAEGTWTWTNGSPATYDRWLAGQPDGGAAANHAMLAQGTTQWADVAGTVLASGYLFERVGLDPLDPDTDGDELKDGRELHIEHSDPVLEDTDGDGLEDGAEVKDHHSDPTDVDTDDDGLDDFVEVDVHHSDPTLADSDEDGFDDFFEVTTGFDPNVASSTPDAESSIRTAVEFRFNAANGASYRIEASEDLESWSVIETGITGEGGVLTRFYSIEGQAKRYFRARRN